jgi:hypothetical protein
MSRNTNALESRLFISVNLNLYSAYVAKAGGRVIAYGCLIKKKEARREHLDYIYRGLMT